MPTQDAVKKRPLEASSGNAQVPQNASQAKRVKKPATPSHWDVTGRYSLSCTSRYRPVDASEYFMTIYHEIDDTTNTAALFGFFMFPNLNLRGILRLCPGEKAKASLTLPEFETACLLAQGAAPSQKNQDWLLRWRGGTPPPARNSAARHGPRANASSNRTGASPSPWCTLGRISSSTRTKPAPHPLPNPRQPATDR